MHIHKISSSKHSHFLNQQRKDPITGDLILEGDEVVFCATCKSAFLKTSWEYMGKQHCESKKTLYIFPHPKSIIISKILPPNNLYFIVSDSFSKTKKKLTKRFGNYWKEEKRGMTLPQIATKYRKSKVSLKNFDLDKSPVLSITLIISFIISILVYFAANLTASEQNIVLVFILLIFTFPFVLGCFRPTLFFDLERKIEEEMFYPPILFFETDKLCLYFENSQRRYYVNYEDISIIRLYYKGTRHMFYKVEIVTQDNYLLYFALQEHKITRDNLLKKIELITKVIYKASKKTLITFKIEPNTQMFYSIDRIRKKSKNIHLENI